MMEDKRKEEIKQKVDTIGGCIKEIKLCEEELAKISEALEFMKRYWYCDVWVKAADEDGSGKIKEFEIPLFGTDASKVIDAIKERLEDKVKECRCGILIQYEKMDKLLK